MGACCPCGAVVPPLYAVVGKYGPRAPGCCQCRIGFGDSLTIRPPPISDEIPVSGCSVGAGDNLVRDAAVGVHSQPATEQSSGLLPETVVLQNIN